MREGEPEKPSLRYPRYKGRPIRGAHGWLTGDGRFYVYRPVDRSDRPLPHWEITTADLAFHGGPEVSFLERRGLRKRTFPTRSRALDALGLALQHPEECQDKPAPAT